MLSLILGRVSTISSYVFPSFISSAHFIIIAPAPKVNDLESKTSSC